VPNIEQYSATGDVAPSDKGIEGAVQAGRRIGAFAHQTQGDIQALGNTIEDHQATMEVSALYKTGVDMENNFEQGWSAFTADPNNKGRTDLADAYMKEHVAPLIDEWASHATTKKSQEVALQMGQRIRSSMFDRTTADQSALDANTAHDNLTGVVNGLSRGAAIDPSSLEGKLGAADTAIEAMGGSIPNVEARTRFQTEMTASAHHDIVVSAYVGMQNAATEQVAQTGDPTKSPALAAMRQSIADGRGADKVQGPEFQEFSKWADEAQRSGMERFKSVQDTAKAQQETAGKGTFAQIDTAITNQITAGLPISPDILKARDDMVRQYGSTNPGEVSALNDKIEHAQEDAQSHKFQTTAPDVTQQIQSRLALGPSDPNYLSKATVADWWAKGKISTDDVNMIDKLRPGPDADPGMKQGLEQLRQYQDQLQRGLFPAGSTPRSGVQARAQLNRDVMATFTGWIRAGKTPGEAIQIMTDEKNPKNFTQALTLYRNAGASADPIAYFKANDRTDGSMPPVAGSIPSPLYPTSRGSATPAAGGTPQGRAVSDKIFGVTSG
jgi:hypothetical protein